MKVKLSEKVVQNGTPHEKGDIVEFDDAFAQTLIDGGAAEEHKEDEENAESSAESN